MALDRTRLSVLIFLVLGTVYTSLLFLYPEFGKNDFIQYWTSFQLYIDGSNPYIPENLLNQQQLINPDISSPMMMWNPPWLLALQAPVHIWSFEFSVKLWVFVQVILYAAGLYLILNLYDFNEESKIYVFLIAVFYFPLFYSIELGQVGALLFFGVSLLFYGFVKDKPISTALGLILMSVKPHLFSLIVIYIVLGLLKNRRYSHLGLTMMVFALLLSITLSVNSSILFYWLEAHGILENAEIVARPVNWITASPISQLRIITTNIGIFAENSLNNAFYIYLLAFIGIGVFLYRISLKPEMLDDRSLLPAVLLGSILVSPFSWGFDWVFLIIVEIDVLSRMSRFSKPKRFVSVSILLMINCLVLFLYVEFYIKYHGQIVIFLSMLASIYLIIFLYMLEENKVQKVLR